MAGTVESIGAFVCPSVNVGVPVCSFPCAPSDTAGFAVGLTGVIFGVYVVVTAVPFVSLA